MDYELTLFDRLEVIKATNQKYDLENNAFSPKEYLSPEEQKELEEIMAAYKGEDEITTEEDDELPF